MSAVFTIDQDKAVRAHLSALARAIRAKFATTAYQGDYQDTRTGETFGDRLQVGTVATVAGVRYLLVLNVLVARNAGGRVSVRVSAWSLDSTGTPVGSWVIARTDLTGVTLTARGFTRRLGGVSSDVDMSQRVATYLHQAKARLAQGHYGRPVVTVHTDSEGLNPYDTTESHLLVFGGMAGAGARLTK